MARSLFCNCFISGYVSSGAGSIVIFKSRNVSSVSARTSQKTPTPSIIKTKHGNIAQNYIGLFIKRMFFLSNFQQNRDMSTDIKNLKYGDAQNYSNGIRAVP